MGKLKQVLNLVFDILFPKFCLGCDKEGFYLCEDCKACIEISENIFCLCNVPKRINRSGKCKLCEEEDLDGIYSAVPYQNKLVKKLISQFEEEPYLKELSIPLSDLIISHFLLLDIGEFWQDKILIPNPLSKKEIKRKGFSPTEEITKRIADNLKLPFKTNLTLEEIREKKIFLVDVLYTPESNLKKTAKFLKESGAEEVWAVVVARTS